VRHRLLGKTQKCAIGYEGKRHTSRNGIWPTLISRDGKAGRPSGSESGARHCLNPAGIMLGKCEWGSREKAGALKKGHKKDEALAIVNKSRLTGTV